MGALLQKVGVQNKPSGTRAFKPLLASCLLISQNKSHGWAPNEGKLFSTPGGGGKGQRQNVFDARGAEKRHYFWTSIRSITLGNSESLHELLPVLCCKVVIFGVVDVWRVVCFCLNDPSSCCPLNLLLLNAATVSIAVLISLLNFAEGS